MIPSIIISLILTIVIELIIALILGIREKSDIITVICANAITNPLVVYLYIIAMLINYDMRYFAITILEIGAVITEFVLYKKYLKFDKISSFIISIVCNILSFAIGIIINLYIS